MLSYLDWVDHITMQCHSNLLLDCVSCIEYNNKMLGGEGLKQFILLLKLTYTLYDTNDFLKNIQFFHNKLPQIKKLMQLWAFKGFGWMNFSNYWYMNMIKSQIDSTSNYICCHIGYQIDQMIYHTIAIASLFHTSLSNKQ